MRSRPLPAAAVFCLLLASPLFAGAATVELPRTGQNACYDATGVIIDCADTGQDGDTRAGAPWPSPVSRTTGTGPSPTI